MLGRFSEFASGFLTSLGNLETRVLTDEIAAISIDKPIYITGLARSGSTIILEMLSSLDQLATHKYRDFPFLSIPYFWNWFVDRASTPVKEKERAHNDGIMVSPESPEAMEEVLWMKFFSTAHDPTCSQVLDSSTERDDFARFYVDHIRKLLYIRGKKRFLSKANYSVTRIPYLLELFPDARFIVPVREPENHIASLMKQHALFSAEEIRDPRILDHMKRAGHYEFGLNRTAINTGDSDMVNSILDLWQSHEIQGWARYWTSIYNHILAVRDSSPELTKAIQIVRYEDLCTRPADTLVQIFDHCDVDVSTETLGALAQRPKFPTYYRSEFSESGRRVIANETGRVRGALGYQ